MCTRQAAGRAKSILRYHLMPEDVATANASLRSIGPAVSLGALNFRLRTVMLRCVDIVGIAQGSLAANKGRYGARQATAKRMPHDMMSDEMPMLDIVVHARG